MDQNSNAITFVDILSMFVGKGKKLICIVLIAAIICAGAGFGFSMLTEEYGGSITLNVSVTDGSRSLITILSSDKFAERLLLDENGLPPKEYCNAEDYKVALEAAEAYNAARELKKELVREQQLFAYDLSLAETKYTSLLDEYNRINTILTVYKSAWSDEVAKHPNHAATTEKYEALLSDAENAMKSFKAEVRDPALSKKIEIEQKIAVANLDLKDAREAYDKASTKVIDQWRQDPEIKETVKAMSEAISCEYQQRFENIDTTAKEDVDPAELENARFVVINVSTSKGVEFANDILQKITATVPDYAEEQLERISGATEPNCTVISTLASAQSQSEKSPIVTAAIFGVIGAIVAFLIFVFVVIVKGLLPNNLSKKNKISKKDTKTESST